MEGGIILKAEALGEGGIEHRGGEEDDIEEEEKLREKEDEEKDKLTIPTARKHG